MINVGSTPIADLKVGGQQISKVYHGSDLVWDNTGQLITLDIGTVHSSSSPNGFIIVGSTNHGVVPYQSTSTSYGSRGFEINQVTTSVGYTSSSYYTLSRVFDGELDEYGFRSNKTTETSFTLDFKFPFNVILQSVTYCQTQRDAQSALKYASTLNVYRVNNGAIAGTIVNGESVNAAVGASTSIDTSHYTTPVNTLRFNPVYPNENKIMTIGEIKMTVKVNESDYMAWKEEYKLTNNAYIP